MADQQKKDIRPSMSAALGIVVGMIAAKTAEKAFPDAIGDWGAFGLSLIVGVIAAVVVALSVHAVVKPPS